MYLVTNISSDSVFVGVSQLRPGMRTTVDAVDGGMLSLASRGIITVTEHTMPGTAENLSVSDTFTAKDIVAETIVLTDLPTTDPEVEGALWLDTGDLAVSTGPA